MVSRYLRRVGSTNTRARAKAYPELGFGGERMGEKVGAQMALGREREEKWGRRWRGFGSLY